MLPLCWCDDVIFRPRFYRQSWSSIDQDGFPTVSRDCGREAFLPSRQQGQGFCCCCRQDMCTLVMRVNQPTTPPGAPLFPAALFFLELEQFATSRVERAEAREKERKLQKQQQLNDDDGCCQNQPTSRDSRLPARGETPLLMLDRWRKLHDELYDSVNGFDITKVEGDVLGQI